MSSDIEILEKFYQQFSPITSTEGGEDNSWVYTMRLLKCHDVRLGTYTPILDELKAVSIKFFMKEHRVALIIPLKLQGILYGFIFKALLVKEFNIFVDPFIKLYITPRADKALKSFGQPWILTEGVKDALTVSLIYPLTCAYLGSACSSKVAEFISCFTNRVFIMPDNDKAGEEGYKSTAKSLSRHGVTVRRIDYALKDPAVAIEDFMSGDKSSLAELKKRVEFILKIF